MISGPCQDAGDASDMSDKQPCFRTSDGFLPILCQPSAAPEPCEGALNDPATGENLEAFGHVGSLDDLQGPLPDFVQSASEFGTGIPAVSEDVTKPRERMPDRIEHGGGSVPVLNVGSVNGQADEKAGGVGDDMTFASLDLLPGIIARNTATFCGFDALAVNNRYVSPTTIDDTSSHEQNHRKGEGWKCLAR